MTSALYPEFIDFRKKANPVQDKLYHITLLEEFFEYVMSDEGDAFFEGFIDESDSWSERIKRMKKKQGVLCLLPDNAGETELDKFYY